MRSLENNLMGVDDLSHYLGISMSKIYKLVAALKIPHYRIDGRVKFDMKDIDAWKALKKIEPS